MDRQKFTRVVFYVILAVWISSAPLYYVAINILLPPPGCPRSPLAHCLNDDAPEVGVVYATNSLAAVGLGILTALGVAEVFARSERRLSSWRTRRLSSWRTRRRAEKVSLEKK